MKRLHLLLLSLLSGLLLWVSWPAAGFSFLLLVALVPLLMVEDQLYKHRASNSRFAILPYAYLTFIVWNTLSTWWIYNSTVFGVVMAIVFNSLFMALVFTFFHISRRILYSGGFAGKNYGYLILIMYWVTFEYLHLDWDLSWSWLNLGNGFSEYYRFIQWYEYTGTLGGSIWILLTNVMIYILLKSFFNKEKQKRSFVVSAALTSVLIIIPPAISLAIYYNYTETENPVEVVAIQPNIDPYNEKFGGMSTEQQIDKILKLAAQKATQKTTFFVAPETALPEGAWLDELNLVPSIIKIRAFLQQYPQASMVIGATTYQMYKEGEASATARQYPGLKSSYDVCNSALHIDTSQTIQVYHKSKLVPGVEKMPYPQIFGFLEKFAIDLGGMVGSHGTQKERSVFTDRNHIKVAPVICYESIYGDFVTGYIRNGAQFIFIITNDGWWGNTPGHRQHNSYARLRAIETRRSIARSANTGISSFLNQRGDMFQKTQWWHNDVIAQTINANDKLTVYVRYGDYPGRVAAFTTLLVGLFTVVTLITKRVKKRK